MLISYEEYINKHYEETLSLLRELCVIGAPSHYEDRRAEFCLAYFRNLGLSQSYIDEAKNVICIIGDENEKMIAFMAHTDVVFPDADSLPISEDEEKIYCPGVGDDTACLVNMMVAVKYIVENNIRLGKTVMFAANSCEEGLGNLKGSRCIFDRYGSRIEKMYTFDGTFAEYVNASVGSHRYRVTVKTEGGHSYGNFGNKNAIAVLSEAISNIYAIKPPVKGNSKTTYNVGIIQGGTSINTICQEASMLCEYRSDSVECLAVMKKKFEEIFANTKKQCLSLDVELIGDRPCASGVNEQELLKMGNLVKSIQEKYSRMEVRAQSGSTDANVPLSMGIPAICVGNYDGAGVHTREEYMVKESIKPGFCITADLILTEAGE